MVTTPTAPSSIDSKQTGQMDASPGPGASGGLSLPPPCVVGRLGHEAKAMDEPDGIAGGILS